MGYRITVEQLVEEEKSVRGDYGIIGKKADGEPAYGYAPSTRERVSEMKPIYTQEVEHLHLKKVIDAVNCPEPLAFASGSVICTCKGSDQEHDNLVDPFCPTHGIRKS